MDIEYLCPSVTSLDALESKISSVLAGYFEDPYLRCLSEHLHHSKKMPIINRGYYNRVKCIGDVVDSFISLSALNNEKNRVQLVNLGAGYDTLSLNLLTRSTSPTIHCFEVDFPTVLARKTRLLQSHCGHMIPDIAEEYLKSVAADLTMAESVIEGLLHAGFDTTAPTIFITECVLVYMTKEKAAALLSALISTMKNATIPDATQAKCIWVSYDMIQPGDAFGRVMCRNLQSAGHHVPGFTDYPTLTAQKQRFIDAGASNSTSCTMLHAYHVLITPEEQQRLQHLEMMDEIEEWELINRHYAVTIASIFPNKQCDSILQKYNE